MIKSDVWDLIKRFCITNKGTISFYVLFSVFGHAIESLAIPKLLAKIFTEINDLEKLKKNIFYFIVIFTVQKIFYVLSNFMNRKIEPNLTSFLTVEFVQGIFRKYESTHKPIDVAITLEKITCIRQALEDSIYYIYKMVPVIIVLIITLITIFFVNIKLGLFVMTSVICLIIVVIMIKKPKDDGHAKDAMFNYLEDIFLNVDLVSSSENGISVAEKNIIKRVEDLKKSKTKTVLRVGYNQAIGYFLATVLYLASIIFLYKLYKNGEIIAKTFEANLLILGQLFKLTYDMAYYLPDFMRNIQIIKTNGIFVSELFSYKSKMGKLISLKRTNISFDNVSYGYDNNNNILNNFSYTIPVGTMLALYGKSGSGKTTFTNLILDILQPISGNVYLDNYTTTELDKRSIKRCISNVSQDTSSLMQTSIYKNIIYSFEDTPELKSKILTIIEEYNISKIFNNPNFLDINVDKGGTSLSGGQRQIVHLLHAVINDNAKVIILDEPTSALDEESKYNILDLLKRLNSEGRTIIIITHDNSVRKICDKSLLFSKGNNPREI